MKLMWALGSSGVLHLTLALLSFKAVSPSTNALAQGVSAQTPSQLWVLPVEVLSAPSASAPAAPPPLPRVAPRSTRRAMNRFVPDKNAAAVGGEKSMHSDDPGSTHADDSSSTNGLTETVGSGRTGPSSALESSSESVFDIAALHRALAEAARKCYPAAARRFQLKGTAQVEFCLAGEGALISANVTSSSGETLLDAAATRCVIPSSLPLPKAALGRCFRAPVRFGFETVD